jgi:translation initiation factor IF-3
LNKGKFYRLNEKINSPEVRVVSDTGSEVFKTTEALIKAREAGLDLVEVVPEATPPIAKIVDFKKFLFDQKKKKEVSKKKARVKKQETKEFRFGPFIGQNDLDFRINRAIDFLNQGDKVKVTIQFHGREITKKEFGKEKIEMFIKGVGENGEVESGPELRGMFLSILIKPRK